MGSTAYLSGAPFVNPEFEQESCCSNFRFLCSILSTIFCPFRPFVFWPLYCLSSYLRLRIVPLLQIVQPHRSITSHECRIGGALSMADCQVIIRKAWPWTKVGNVFGECHDPCMQKELYCRFRQRAGALQPLQETQFVVLTQISMLSVGVNNVELRTHLFPHFDIVFFI